MLFPALPIGELRMNSDGPDAQIIDICRQMLSVHHEWGELVEWDPYALEEGAPNHGRHEALLAEFAALGAALTKAARPTTPEGIRMLAEVAMLFADRTREDDLSAPEDFATWVTLFALTSAARAPEPIPLPAHLLFHWPE